MVAERKVYVPVHARDFEAYPSRLVIVDKTHLSRFKFVSDGSIVLRGSCVSKRAGNVMLITQPSSHVLIVTPVHHAHQHITALQLTRSESWRDLL